MLVAGYRVQVTLDEFYESIESLSDDLSLQGKDADGTVLMAALRGGSTSGEILTDLGVTLRRLDGVDGPFHKRYEDALTFI